MKCFRKTIKLILCVMLVSMSMTLPTKAAEETNIALNKPAISSAVEGIYVASNAVDGNTGTFWASKNPSEIEIDLEGYYKVSKINLMAYFGAATEVDRSYNYEIYGSTD